MGTFLAISTSIANNLGDISNNFTTMSNDVEKLLMTLLPACIGIFGIKLGIGLVPALFKKFFDAA